MKINGPQPLHDESNAIQRLILYGSSGFNATHRFSQPPARPSLPRSPLPLPHAPDSQRAPAVRTLATPHFFSIFSSLSPATPARAAPPPAAAAARGPVHQHAPRPHLLACAMAHPRRLTLPRARDGAACAGRRCPAPSPAGRHCRSHAQLRPRPPAAHSPHALVPMPPLALAVAAPGPSDDQIWSAKPPPRALSLSLDREG